MATSKIILVTGANKGLGFAIIRVAAARDPSSHYILACRDLDAGSKAIDDLRNAGITAPLDLLKIDVTNDTDIVTAVEFVAEKHGRLDVLINNAGTSLIPPNPSIPSLRTTYASLLNTNLTSLACMCAAFQPLLYKSTDPKVINITSGLGSISNTFHQPMRSLPLPAYSVSKTAVNGLTVQLQARENARVGAGMARIRYYAAASGFVKTALTRFNEAGKDPVEGAEVVARLLLGNGDEFPGGTQWEWEGGEMREVGW